MMTVREEHHKAMSLADLAEEAKSRGDITAATAFFRQAFELERSAAIRVAGQDVEPTRSILLRSAASLAIDCEEYTQAEKLICTALAGNPPPEIREELYVLLDQVTFPMHLRLHGITLTDTEIQFSIAGRAVGAGIAPSWQFIDRVQSAQRLIHRTAERQLKRPFRPRGPAIKSIQDDYALFLSVPRQGSFAVTFRIGDHRQLPLPFSEEDGIAGLDASEVVKELIDCLDLFNSGHEAALHTRIPEGDYYDNFVGLARQLAPDGEEVNFVGFTVVQQGVERSVGIRRKPENISIAKKSSTDQSQDELVTVKGFLLYANELGKNEIKLRGEDGFEKPIKVPAGMMGDIVQPLWGEQVKVIGIRKGKTIELLDIQKTEAE